MWKTYLDPNTYETPVTKIKLNKNAFWKHKIQESIEVEFHSIKHKSSERHLAEDRAESSLCICRTVGKATLHHPNLTEPVIEV
jgi:hypothetical protein